MSSGLRYDLRYWLDVGLSSGLRYGLSVGLIVGICSILLQFLLGKNNTTEARSRIPPPAKGKLWQRLIRRREVHNGLLVGLSVGLSIGLSAVIVGLGSELSYGLSYGLSFGLSAGVLSVLFIGRSTAVQPTDLLVWSWRSLGKSLFSKPHASTAVQVTVLLGLSVGLSSGLSYGLSYGLSIGLSIGLGYGLHNGLSSELSYGLNSGLSRALPVGLLVGLLVGLFYGGLACLRHYLLRFLLFRTGSVPWRYARFLDYSAERILLRKVGGGYIFMHGLLLDYFASMETIPSPEKLLVHVPSG